MPEPQFHPQQVLDLWFPETGHQNDLASHGAFWDQRMQGGMDAIICDSFADLARSAARGELDHWADTPRGRLALLIALDQFPRSLWRDTPAAFGQDIKATLLALEGVANGDFDSCEPWEAAFFIIAIGHCEGPDHLARMDLATELGERIIARLPPQLGEMAKVFRAQNARVRDIIERFGRHPHRNLIYGRVSTPDEEVYIAAGDFPHNRKAEDIAATP